MARVHCIGEILSEFVALGDTTLDRPGQYAGPYPSGAPAIFADQVALMGGSVELIGGVGADPFGAGILARLGRDGVGCDGVTERRGLTTGLAFVAYRRDGGRDFVYSIAGSAAEICDVSRLRIGADDVLHVSGSSLGIAPVRDAVLRGVAQARAAGAVISVDPNVRPELFAEPAAREALEQVVAAARWLLPSEEDLALLHPGLDLDAAVAALRRTAERVVVKRGGRGAVVEGPEGRVELPGHPVEVVDATGAGDCFCGSFVARLLAGDEPGEAARLANAAAAISVTCRGPMEGNRPLADVQRFLAMH